MRVAQWVFGTIRSKPPEEIARISSDNTAQIVPFAQAEMVHSFMEGVDPKLRANIYQVFANLLKRFSSLLSSEISGMLTPEELSKLSNESDKAIDTVVREFENEWDSYSRKYHVSPVMTAVALLPKDQLAIMAETLVALTSLR